MKKIIALIAAFVIALVMLGAPATASAAPADKVTICHATGSDSNPYVVNSPSAAGVYNGHIAHQHSEDIIPPFEYKGETYSQNWDAAGQAIWNNGCEVPTPPVDVCPDVPGNQPEGTDCDEPVEIVPAAPQFIDPCGTENDRIVKPESEYIEYRWTAIVDNAIVITAIDKDPNDNVVIAPGATTEWSHQFTDKKCPTEPPVVEPPVVEPPVNEPPVNEPKNPDEPKDGNRVTPDVPTAVDAGLVPVAADFEENEDGGYPLLYVLLVLLLGGAVVYFLVRNRR